MDTKNCIICGKPATSWTGHIHIEIGQITAGWCDDHSVGIRPRVNSCTSINPNSCKGYYKLSEIELTEYLTPENMLQQIEDERFSEMIDAQCSPHHPQNKRKAIFSFFR